MVLLQQMLLIIVHVQKDSWSSAENHEKLLKHWILVLAENMKIQKNELSSLPIPVSKEYIHLQFVQPLKKSNNDTCGAFCKCRPPEQQKSGKNAFYYGARGNSVSTLILIPNALHDMNV